MEMVLVLVLLGILASLAFPKIFITQESLCQEKLFGTLQLIRSKLTQSQIQVFLINDHATLDLFQLSKPFVFADRHCALRFEKDRLIIQSNRYGYDGLILLQKIANTYQWACQGLICPYIQLN